MSHPHEQSSGAAAYDQGKLLLCTSIVELETLQEQLDDPWSGIIETERNRRGAIISSMFSMPRQELITPPYNEEAGPQAYIESIRAENSVRKLDQTSINLFPQEKRLLNRYAEALSWQLGPPKNDPRAYGPSQLFINFLAANLQALLIAPRAHGYRDYEAARFTVLRDHFASQPPFIPGSVTPFNLRHVSGRRLERAHQEVAEIPHQGCLPDFFQLDPSQQQAILNKFTPELEGFWGLRHIAQLPLHSQEVSGTAAFASVATMWKLKDEYPTISTRDIARTFLSEPQNYDSILGGIHIGREAERQRQAAFDQAEADRIEASEEPTTENPISLNEQAVQSLLDDPLVDERVLDLLPHDRLVLHAAEGADTTVRHDDFDAVVSKHLELIGRALYDVLDTPPDTTPILLNWSKFNVGKMLRGPFNGTLRNLAITRLPVDTETLKAVLKDYNPGDIQPEAYTKLLLSVELKRSGIKPETALLELLVGARQIHQKGNIIKYKTSVRTHGNQAHRILSKLEAEAADKAFRQERRARLYPLRVGLPGTRRG